MTVGNSSTRTLHSICGSLLIALTLTDDGGDTSPEDDSIGAMDEITVQLMAVMGL